MSQVEAVVRYLEKLVQDARRSRRKDGKTQPMDRRCGEPNATTPLPRPGSGKLKIFRMGVDPTWLAANADYDCPSRIEEPGCDDQESIDGEERQSEDGGYTGEGSRDDDLYDTDQSDT